MLLSQNRFDDKNVNQNLTIDICDLFQYCVLSCCKKGNWFYAQYYRDWFYYRPNEHSQCRGSVAHFSLSQQFLIKVLIWMSVTLSWQMTSGRGGLQLWKCLYLARNVTKGNNVPSQSTLMDLPTISPVPPLTRETRETTANKAALPLTARVLLTAVHPGWPPQRPQH